MKLKLYHTQCDKPFIIMKQKYITLCFSFRVIKIYEHKYDVTDLECLVSSFVTKIIFYFRPLKFTIESDQLSVLYINDFNKEYIKGKENIVADALTKNKPQKWNSVKTKCILRWKRNISRTTEKVY